MESTILCSGKVNLANGHLFGAISSGRSLLKISSKVLLLMSKLVPTLPYASRMSSYCSKSSASRRDIDSSASDALTGSPVAQWMGDVALQAGVKFYNLDEAAAIARIPRKCLVQEDSK